MIRKLFITVVLALSLALIAGCASTLDDVNRGAEDVGEAGGKVINIPNSVSEGAAESVKGQPESNPYNR